MSSFPTNRYHKFGWISLGAIVGIAVTLGLFFVLSGFNGEQGQTAKPDSNFSGSESISNQDPSNRSAVQIEDVAAPTLLEEQNPKAVWFEKLKDEQPDIAQLADLIYIAKAWMDESGIQVIREISDSQANTIVRNAVVDALLHRATQNDAQSALQFALGLPDSLRDFALSAVTKAWANTNPIQALNYVSTIDSGSVRRQMLERLVRSWAENDPRAVLQEIELIPSNLRDLGKREALLALARTAPEETVSMLAGISDMELKFALTMEVASSWTDEDLNAALEWAVSADIPARNQVLTVILGKLALQDPELALQTALSQPLDDSLFGLELSVVSEVAEFDLELALEMLSQVREGLTEYFSYSEIGKALVRNKQTDRALDLALGLPEDERGAYYNRIVHEWAISHPESLVDQLENLPSTEAKYQASMGLVYRNVGTNVLTKTQMDYVRNFLPEDYNSETGRRGTERGGTYYQDPGLTEKQYQEIREYYMKMMEDRTEPEVSESASQPL